MSTQSQPNPKYIRPTVLLSVTLSIHGLTEVDEPPGLKVVLPVNVNPGPEVVLPVNVNDGVFTAFDRISCGAPPPAGPLPTPPRPAPASPPAAPPTAPSRTSPSAFVAAVLKVGSVIAAICCCQSWASAWSIRTSTFAALVSPSPIAPFC